MGETDKNIGKQCKICSIELLEGINWFLSYKRRLCADCFKLQTKLKNATYRAKNKDKIRTQQNTHYENNSSEIKIRRKEQRKRNAAAISKRNKQYYIDNKNTCSDYNKDYYKSNQKILDEKNKSYKENNSDTVKIQQKKYREDNKNNKQLYDKEYRRANKSKIREKDRLYNNKRQKEDLFYRLYKSMSNCIRKMLKNNGTTKNNESCRKFFPFSENELKHYIESLFEPWMSWANHGGYNKTSWDDNNQSTWTWNLDHIKPHSKFRYKTMSEELFKECWSLDNLRPYSAKLNVIENNKRTDADVLAIKLKVKQKLDDIKGNK